MTLDEHVGQVGSRNAPCPCGSGRRYKDCHGRVAARPAMHSVDDALARRAQALLDAGRVDDARAALLEGAAVAEPGDEARIVLGAVEARRGYPIEAVVAWAPLLPRAWTGDLPEPLARRFWHEFGPALGEAAAAIAKRGSPAAEASSTGESASDMPGIAAVLLVPARASGWREALASIRAQSHAPLELLVADRGSDDGHAIDDALDALPFPGQRVGCFGLGAAEALRAALAKTRADAIALLDADHAWAAEHLASIAASRAAGHAWGFAAVDVPVADDGDDAQREAWRLAAARARQAVAEAESVGAATIDQAPPLVVPTNLWFRRVLASAHGVFPGPRGLWGWRLALALLRSAEPAFEARATYRLATPPRRAPDVAEADLLAVLRPFYAAALRDASPPNRDAPLPANLGDAFFRRPLALGHVLLFEREAIDALVGRVVAFARPVAGATPAPGVTFAGYAHGDFGLGENLRALARACAADGLPFDVRDIGARLSSRQSDRSMLPYLADRFGRRCTVFCVNPDVLDRTRQLVEVARRHGSRVVGNFFWELDRVPEAWHAPIDRVDEVWVATRFVADAMRAATAKPVVVVPTPVAPAGAPGFRRADFGLPEGPFVFLFSFDYHASAERKNPEALVDAFRAAFPPGRDDVRLLVKSINGAHHRERSAALDARRRGDPRILLRDGFLDRSAVGGLQAVCDAYVSLHRAEGLGLGLAECMARGKPAIATRWSGNLDFMDDDNSGLVDCRVVGVPPGAYPFVDAAGWHWAEPDVEHAARLMRRLVDDRAWRETIAARGRRDVLARLSPAATAGRIAGRLRETGAL